MPILLALIAVAGVAYFWYWRARNAAEVASEVADMAQSVLGAARRFGFRRRANVHPVDSIEDPKLAVGGLATAFFELSGMPTAEQKHTLVIGLQSVLDLPLDAAEEMVVLGHWLVNACNGPSPAVSRLARKVRTMSGIDGLTQAMAILDRVASVGGGLSPGQREALDEVKRIFRLT
jgi:hypothetical protein